MSARNKVTTILFDLDGTLLDTAPDLAWALNQLLVRRGQAPLAIEKVRETITNGTAAMLDLAFGIDKSHPEFHDLRRELLDEYTSNISNFTVFFPGMDKALQILIDMGINWGIVTNKPHHLAEQLVKSMNLDHHCACLVGAIEGRKSKPDPAPLQYACELLNTEPEHCVYVGDAQSDIEAAKRINMPSIAAMYGYIEKHAKPESWAADYYIDKPMDIIDWLKRS